MNGWMKNILSLFYIKKLLFKLKSLNIIIRREDPVELY